MMMTLLLQESWENYSSLLRSPEKKFELRAWLNKKSALHDPIF